MTYLLTKELAMKTIGEKVIKAIECRKTWADIVITPTTQVEVVVTVTYTVNDPYVSKETFWDE